MVKLSTSFDPNKWKTTNKQTNKQICKETMHLSQSYIYMPDVFSNILQKEQISWCGFIMQTFSLIRQRNPSSFFYFLVLIAEAKT